MGQSDISLVKCPPTPWPRPTYHKHRNCGIFRTINAVEGKSRTEVRSSDRCLTAPMPVMPPAAVPIVACWAGVRGGTIMVAIGVSFDCRLRIGHGAGICPK
jgi:hypothetical protein